MAHELKCHYCGKSFQGKRSDAKYCGNTCRTYASRNNVNKKSRKGKSLSGLSDQVQKTTSQQPPAKLPVPEVPKNSEPKPLTFADMPQLRLYREKKPAGNVPAPPDPPEAFTETRPEEIELEYRVETHTKPNPDFALIVQKQNDVKIQVDRLQQALVIEEKKLADVQNEDNISPTGYAGGIVAGGLFGKQWGGNFWSMLLGGAVGYGAMKLFDSLTVDSFVQEKQKRVIAKQQGVNAIKAKLAEISKVQLHISAQKLTNPEMLSYQVRIITNRQAVEQRKQEIADFDQRKTHYDQMWQKYETEMQKYREKYGDQLQGEKNSSKETTAPLVDNPAIISGAQLLQGRGEGIILFQGKWKTFIGEPSRTFLIAIHGPSGSGKSHLAVQSGLYLNIMHGTVLYVSGEEGHSETMRRKLSKYAGSAKMDGYDFADISTKEELFKIVSPNKYNFIILDSINNMRINADDLRDIVTHYSCSAIIVICQNTKKGEIRGSYEVVHDADVKIRVENGIAYTDKNRFIDDKPELDVFNIGPVPPIPKISEPKIIPLNFNPDPKPEPQKPDDQKKKPDADTGQDGDNNPPDGNKNKDKNNDPPDDDDVDLDDLRHII